VHELCTFSKTLADHTQRGTQFSPHGFVVESFGACQHRARAPSQEPPRWWSYPVNFEMDGGEGKASRWNTLRALRVLDWYSA
jgi:hypothetical protein